MMEHIQYQCGEGRPAAAPKLVEKTNAQNAMNPNEDKNINAIVKDTSSGPCGCTHEDWQQAQSAHLSEQQHQRIAHPINHVGSNQGLHFQPIQGAGESAT